MSSDGEMSEAQETSQESQGPEYAAEVKKEAEELEDGEISETDMDEDDSDFDPEEPEPSEDEEEMVDASAQSFWSVTRLEFPTFPALFGIVHCQGLPDWDVIQHKLDQVEIEGIKSAQSEKSLRAFRRVVRATRDFWDHVHEEFSDHIQWTERNIRRIEKRSSAPAAE